MNKIFKVIWNHVQQRFVVTSELTKSKGKKSSKVDKRVVIAALGLVSSAVFPAVSTQQLPMWLNGLTIYLANGQQYTAFGYNSTVETEGTVLGMNVNASGYGASAFGYNVTATGRQSTAVGGYSIASGDHSIALGFQASATEGVATAIGAQASATLNGSVAVGGLSKTRESDLAEKVSVGNINYSNFAAGKSDYKGLVFSVGDIDFERQIQNVAAGQISGTSTDAINGSQLYSVMVAVDNLATSTATHLGGGGSC